MTTDLAVSAERSLKVPKEVLAADQLMVYTWLRSKRSPHTREAYEHDIVEFYRQVQKPLASVTLLDLQDYAEWLATVPLPKSDRLRETSTQRQMLYAVKSLLTFAQKQGYNPFNVGTALQPPQGKDTLAERILSVPQILNIIYEAKRSSSHRNYVMLLLLYASGIRCEELCNLQWRDCKENGESGQITVFGKERATRAVLLHPKAWQELQSIKPQPTDLEGYVFSSRQTTIRNGVPSRRLDESSVWKAVTKIAKRTGVYASPHFFRHAHATHTMGNVPQRVIQQTLGWKSPMTMMKYQHVLPGESSSLALKLL